MRRGRGLPIFDSMGETRIDLLRLLEDLRDAYPGPIEETILTELVANALDSGAKRVTVRTDPVAATLAVSDNGTGMSRAAFRRYHDLAVTGKRRGRSIGFAGVGVKLGLLVADEVTSETQTPRAGNALATSWRLASRTRAPWRWIEPSGLLEGSGTRVCLYLSNGLSRLLDPGFVESTLLRHFEPLFDPAFDEILESQYPDGVGFLVNERLIPRTAADPGRVALRVRVGRQRKLSGVGFLLRDPELDDEARGIAVSTLGKVIKRGWDWLGVSPARPADVDGLIEVPALAEALTLNKADFVRTGSRGATFLAYRKAVQEVVTTQLEAWGEGPATSGRRRSRAGALERDLRSVLADLSETYPLLSTLVERRAGGQRRLPLGDGGSALGTSPGTSVDVSVENSSADGDEETQASSPESASDDARPEAGDQANGVAGASIPDADGRKRPARYGLRLRFERRPEDPSLGRLIETTVYVSDAHPACRRATASRSIGYHGAGGRGRRTRRGTCLRDGVSAALGRDRRRLIGTLQPPKGRRGRDRRSRSSRRRGGGAHVQAIYVRQRAHAWHYTAHQ